MLNGSCSLGPRPTSSPLSHAGAGHRSPPPGFPILHPDSFPPFCPLLQCRWDQCSSTHLFSGKLPIILYLSSMCPRSSDGSQPLTTWPVLPDPMVTSLTPTGGWHCCCCHWGPAHPGPLQDACRVDMGKLHRSEALPSYCEDLSSGKLLGWESRCGKERGPEGIKGDRCWRWVWGLTA